MGHFEFPTRLQVRVRAPLDGNSSWAITGAAPPCGENVLANVRGPCEYPIRRSATCPIRQRAMKEKPNQSTHAVALRRRAEVRLRELTRNDSVDVGNPGSPADALRLVHELQVHRVELEMQNSELQDARDRAEGLLEKYADLYDFAPVGYFTLDEASRILEVNLTGAALLGVVRSQLIRRTLASFVVPASQVVFRTFLESVFAGRPKQIDEVELLKNGGSPDWVSLHGLVTEVLNGSGPRCRVVVSNIGALKRAEEAQRHVEALALTNRELREEVARRRVVETALKQSDEQLRRLSHQILQAQEEERRRISRELHDEITQTLVGINVNLENLARETTVSPEEFRGQIALTQKLVEQSVNIVHQFALELRPPSLDDLGLIDSLHSLMRDFMKRTGVRGTLTAFAGVEKLSGTQRTVVYRVVQSALSNVGRHARATRVTVNIHNRTDIVEVEIADNGISFDIKRALNKRHNKHLGLLGMRERVEMIGGAFAVESAPGQGTTVRARIPFRKRIRT